MAKYRSKPQVRRELSDEAKLARLRQWEQQYKLNSEDINKLIEKFGPYAYDVVRYARAEPANVANRINQPFRNSNRTIHYFAETEMDTATLAKAIKKSEMQVEAGLAQYNIDAKQTLENAEIKSVQMTADRQQKKFEEQVDEHVAAKDEPVREEQPQLVTAPEETNTNDENDDVIITGESIGVTMTLDDYVKYYEPKDKPLKGQELKDAAYNDFGKGEGVSLKIHVEQPNKGSPTIGVGNVIFPQQLLDPNLSAEKKKKYGSLPAYKQRFMNMGLTKTVGSREVPLSAAEKGKIFDDLVTAVKNGTLVTKNEGGFNVIVSPASAKNVNMPAASIRKQFDKDIDAALKKTYTGLGKGNQAKGKEILEKYPRDLQLALLHAYYGGTPGLRITKAIQEGKVNPEDPVAVLTKLANERIVGDDQALEALRNLNPEEFTDAKIAELKRKYRAGRRSSSSPRAPIRDARQMGHAADSLDNAQRRRQAELELQYNQQRQKNLDNNIRIVMSMNQQNTPS